MQEIEKFCVSTADSGLLWERCQGRLCELCLVGDLHMLIARTLWLWFFFFFSSRRRHTRLQGDWSSDVCSSDLVAIAAPNLASLRTGRCARRSKRFGLRGGFRAVRPVPASDESKCQPQRRRIERQQKQFQEQERQKNAALDAAAQGESEALERAVGLSFERREQQDQQQIGDHQPLQHALPANSGAGRLLWRALQEEPGEHRVDE